MLRLNSIFRKAVREMLPRLYTKIQVLRAAKAERDHWNERIKNVLACPANRLLPRVENAGEIENGFQIMHNGIKVVVDGYYGSGLTRLLKMNKGSHEPEEEVIFGRIIEILPPSPVMVELGAYWGFYSMWLCKSSPYSKVFLIEPNHENLIIGQDNFSANGLSGDFTQAYIGDKSEIAPDGEPIINVDSFLRSKNINHLNILHADIQGFEVAMLEGARSSLESNLIDYIFISTHSNELHEECLKFLEDVGYLIICSIDLKQTYSFDGLVVAHSPIAKNPDLSTDFKENNDN